MPQRGPSCQRNLRNQHTNQLSWGHAVTRQAGETSARYTRGDSRQERAWAKRGPLSTMAWVGGSLKLRSVHVVDVVGVVQNQHSLLLSFRTSFLSSDVQGHVQLQHLALTGLQMQPNHM